MVLRRPLTRSQQMARIRGKNTGPEKRFRSALWSAGLRYRVHADTPVGKPDVVFPGKKLAIFIDGCFWHGCPRHYVRPGSRVDFWAEKLRTTIVRDRRQTLALEDLGWSVLRVWEHEVFEELDAVVREVRRVLEEGCPDLAPSWRVVRVDEIDKATRQERRHFEQLRDPKATRSEEGRRITAKWRRPKV